MRSSGLRESRAPIGSGFFVIVTIAPHIRVLELSYSEQRSIMSEPSDISDCSMAIIGGVWKKLAMFAITTQSPEIRWPMADGRSAEFISEIQGLRL